MDYEVNIAMDYIQMEKHLENNTQPSMAKGYDHAYVEYHLEKVKRSKGNTQ